MTQGVSIATKKDGTVYYRAGLYYKNKHISLGSYAGETTAGNAYLEALAILGSLDQLPEDYIEQPTTLSFEKIIVLLNFRNNGIYFKNPIYLRNGYFSYYLSRIEELKFDVDQPQDPETAGASVRQRLWHAVFHPLPLRHPPLRCCRKRLSVCQRR